MWWRFKPYVSVAQRRAKAAQQIIKMKKKGYKASPVRIEGRAIARTFWGQAWCENLQSYSDYENRLPRGRTYVRNGSVVDLQIKPGRITAMVAGSDLYKIEIGIKPAGRKAWDQIKRRCAGQIGSLIELLQGRLSQGVMQIITHRDSGLFPEPAEIDLDCSCPDWADMCKHVAAVLYGVGARLDEKPELLFVLRKVDHLELITQAGDVRALTKSATKQKTIAADELANVFGIELDVVQHPAAPTSASLPTPSRRAKAGQPANRSKVATSTAPKAQRRLTPVPSKPSSKRAKTLPAGAATAASGPMIRSADKIARKRKKRSAPPVVLPKPIAVSR